VRVVDALLPEVHPGGWPEHLDPRAERVHADVRELPDGVLDGIDVISHQAAVVGLGLDLQDLPLYVGVNELGTATLLAAADRAGIGRVVLASSMVVYGEGRYRCAEHGLVRPEPRTPADLDAGRFEVRCPLCGADLEPGLVPENAPLDPRSTYAATKLAQEHLASAWARQTGGSVWALRYHNVYGPRMPRDTPYAGVASIFRSALERGGGPRVMEDGKQRRDFVHVTDVAACNALALAADHAGFAAANVCSGEPHTIGDLATELAAAMGGKPPVVVGGARPGDVRHVVADPALARRMLGFRAEVRFADGVAAFATAPLRDPAGLPDELRSGRNSTDR
jgi:dTDP-L-rhamnose 4-epimerase